MKFTKQVLIYVMGIISMATGLLYSEPLPFDDSLWEVRSNSGSDYWAIIGNSGNNPDIQMWNDFLGNGYVEVELGSVGYEYSIGKYEVTNTQYIKFLNDINAASDGADGLYSISPYCPTYYGITCIDGEFQLKTHVYDTETYKFYENKPVTHMSWYDALRFINWLNSGNSEYGAYMFINGELQTNYYDGALRNPLATYWLPNEDEWYKGAYYDPDLDEGQGGYWEFPTGSNTAPTVEAPAGGTNSANYYDWWNDYFAIQTDPYLTDVGAYENSDSPYGTYDQGGNVFEWNETLIYGDPNQRGGACYHTQRYLSASNNRYSGLPSIESNGAGFRIASSYTGSEHDFIPEPMTVGLLATGLIGIVIRSRNRK